MPAFYQFLLTERQLVGRGGLEQTAEGRTIQNDMEINC